MTDADPEAGTLAAPLGATGAAEADLTESVPKLLAGRYELLGMLGAGAMGTVYRARDRELDEVMRSRVSRARHVTDALGASVSVIGPARTA